MKIRKLMLPVMAFVCAIGMAFTTVSSIDTQTSGEILRNGSWEPVPVSCSGTGNFCQVRFTSEPSQIYDVYSSTNHSLKLKSSNEEPMIITD